jgi:hypothetical protein
MQALDLETRCNPVRNEPGTLPVGHMYGVAILSKTPNLVVEISNDHKVLRIAITRAFKNTGFTPFL